MIRKCIHCSKELTGNQRLYCCDNHKRYVLRKEREQIMREFKYKFPFLLQRDINDDDYIVFEWVSNNIDKVKKLIDSDGI